MSDLSRVKQYRDRCPLEPGLLDRLREAAASLEETGAWPGEQFRWLGEQGVLRWNIPRPWGDPRSGEEMTAAYEFMAAACLTTTFVLTQRNSACQRIIDAERDDVRQKLLPGLAAGRLFATVGISHLTTSRQHLAEPAVRARRDGEHIVLSGIVPWVTGAAFADYIVTGGTWDDGRQVLIALPRDSEGVQVSPPTRLLALSASHTTSVTLKDVRVPHEFVLAGPVEGVIGRSGGGGTGSLTTSALAVGLTRRAVEHLETEAARRNDLNEIVESLRRELSELRSDLYSIAGGAESGSDPQMSAAEIRRRANSLVLRATQAYLAASKGAGFVAGHPAERAVREAMFFLVWSCPQPVVAAALREFACLAE